MRRLMVYDRTCTHHGRIPVGLTHAWRAGGPLYSALGQLDAWHGAASWEEALDWLGTVDGDASIREIQFWGHGRWGRALIDGQSLDASALAAGHPLHQRLEGLRERMAPDGQWWFRTCETLGARAGQDFAARWSDFMGCAVAGHTYIIGHLQSGLHRLEPGRRAHWDPWEGIAAGRPSQPERAFWSWVGAPHTITCLQSSIPPGW